MNGRYVLEEYTTELGKRTVVGTFVGTRKEARHAARQKSTPKKHVREVWKGPVL